MPRKKPKIRKVHRTHWCDRVHKVPFPEKVFGVNAGYMDPGARLHAHMLEWAITIFGKAFAFPLCKGETFFHSPQLLNSKCRPIIDEHFSRGNDCELLFIKHLNIGFVSNFTGMPEDVFVRIMKMRVPINDNISQECLKSIVRFIRPRPSRRTKRRVQQKQIGRVVRLAKRLYVIHGNGNFEKLLKQRYSSYEVERLTTEFYTFAKLVSHLLLIK